MYRATAGQEDPFELDSNLLLSSGRHGEDRKRQYFGTTMKHRYLSIWLTYCTKPDGIASFIVLEITYIYTVMIVLFFGIALLINRFVFVSVLRIGFFKKRIIWYYFSFGLNLKLILRPILFFY